MGRREGVWGDGMLSWSGVELAAWAALPAPPAVRAILADWAAPGDPAPLLPRERDPAALLACYRALVARRPVSLAALALLRENAQLNSEFGLWRELRGEAAAVLRWLAPLAADAGAVGGLTSPVRPAPPCTSPDSAATA